MRQIIRITLAVAIAAGSMAAQSSQSPASQSAPKTVKPQAYPAAQIRAGEAQFTSQCGFCHGRDAAGGETGPDLTRSTLVAEDTRGDKIGPVVRTGRVDKGMPSFSFGEAGLNAIVAFIHDQKTKAEKAGGGRRSVDVADLATGNPAAGRSYFNGAGKCSQCHSPQGDLAHVATRYSGLALMRRMLYPTGPPAPKPATAAVTTAAGQTIAGPLTGQDEFTITLLDPAGAKQTYEKSAVTFRIHDPVAAHFDQLGKFSDNEMHNVYAFLATLK